MRCASFYFVNLSCISLVRQCLTTSTGSAGHSAIHIRGGECCWACNSRGCTVAGGNNLRTVTIYQRSGSGSLDNNGIPGQTPTCGRTSRTDLLGRALRHTMRSSHFGGDFRLLRGCLPPLATVVATRPREVADPLWSIEPTNAKGARRPQRQTPRTTMRCLPASTSSSCVLLNPGIARR